MYMEINKCINFMLTKAQQTVYQYFKGRLADFDVTPVQYGVLQCLWQEDGLTPGQIAASLCLDGSTITGVLDRMENKGLVKRTPDPSDRRALRVILTEQGTRLREPVQRVIEEANRCILDRLSKEEQEQFITYLERIGS